MTMMVELSFIAQSHHGIDAHGAAGREITSQQSDRQEKRGHQQEGTRVERAEPEQNRGKHGGDSGAENRSYQRAQEHRKHGLTDDEPHHMTNICAKGHANADLANATADSVGNRAVNSE